MKRIYIIASILILIFTAFNAGAQDAEKLKSYVSIYSGLSNPIGSYASTDYSNNQSGFAKKSVAIQLDGVVYIKKHFGIGATISWQDQGKLDTGRTGALARGYVSSYHATSAEVGGYDRFHSWNALVGPQYSFTYKDFILDLRLDAGLIWVTSTPETAITLLGVPEQTAVFYQRTSHGFVFGYGANAGLRYKLGDSWTVGLKAAYVGSPGTNITNDGRTENLGRLETKLPISEIQTTLGFSLSF